MNFAEIKHADGSWNSFIENWKSQCETFGEDISSYAIGTLSVLENLSKNPERRAGVFAISTEEKFLAACQLNSTPLPGYVGNVLRVRHLTICPNIDFGESEEKEYEEIISEIFNGIISLSNNGNLSAPHIKFHLTSPADRRFFEGVRLGLKSSGLFQSAELKGSWLYITKRT